MAKSQFVLPITYIESFNKISAKVSSCTLIEELFFIIYKNLNKKSEIPFRKIIYYRGSMVSIS